MKIKNFASLVITSVLLTACSTIKSPKSANFNRVKYNSHFNLAEKQVKKKLPETVNSFKQKTELEVNPKRELVNADLETSNQEKLIVSVKPVKSKSKTDFLRSSDQPIKIKESRKSKRLQGLFDSKGSKKINSKSSINNYLNKPAPVVEDLPLGDILYVILVVLLVLIVISLISQLAGGLIGALIAILLILLLLRLLGYV